MATVMLRAGFARRDVTPDGSVYLGGYFTVTPRMSTGVHDPLFVRALALEQSSVRVVVLIFDMLVITDELARGLRHALASTGAHVMAIATHTHSAPGGFWSPLAARLSMGPVVPGCLEQWIAVGAELAREALADLQPARWATHTGLAPEAAVNRRDVRLPADAHVWSLLLERDHDSGILCGGTAHPVVVAENEHTVISADFPGTITKALEQQVAFAAFVNGSLCGGGTVLKPGGVDVALEAQAQPITAQAIQVLKAPRRSSDATLAFVQREIALPSSPAPRASFDDQSVAKWLTRPLDALGRWLFSEAMTPTTIVQALALGDTTLLGLPVEPGFDIALALRESAKALGFETSFVAAHANGYLGYVLRREGYRHAPAGDTLFMAMYENVMNVYGPDFGERLLVEGRRLLEDLARAVAAAGPDRLAAIA